MSVHLHPCAHGSAIQAMAKSLGTQKYEQRLILPLGYVNFLFSLIILVISAADILVSTRFTVLRRLFCVVLLLAVLPPPPGLSVACFLSFSKC